jgi:hypothetical protein
MNIYFKLDKKIDPNKLLQELQKLINRSEVNENSIIEISIKNIAYDDTEIIPKLEYKNEQTN